MRNSADYNLAVLEDIQRGTIGMGRARWALRWGGIACRLPAMFLVVRICPDAKKRIPIPVFLPLLLLLFLPVAVLVQFLRTLVGKGPYPGVWAVLRLLWQLPFMGREPLVDVYSPSGGRVQITLW